MEVKLFQNPASGSQTANAGHGIRGDSSVRSCSDCQSRFEPFALDWKSQVI